MKLKKIIRNAKRLYTSLTAMHTIPKYVEISKNSKPFKVNMKDPNFDRPYNEMLKTY